jgi:nucleotide-binding universal stress UspA family protein
MGVEIKDILSAAISLERDEGALRAAELIARVNNAHAKALILSVHPASDFAEPIAPLSVVLEDIARGPQSEAALEQKAIEAWVARSYVSFEIASLSIEAALGGREILAHARHADLIIMTRPAPHGDRAHHTLFETLLFGAGKPVLLVPVNWRGDALGRRILIAWNARREATRAVADAMPFLVGADKVVVATVDALPSGDGHGERPGHDLAAHLARHGVKAEVENLDGLGRSAAERLLETAREMNADMIVMGGYGHARAAEWLLGGATRDMTEMAEIPILLSH